MPVIYEKNINIEHAVEHLCLSYISLIDFHQYMHKE